MSTALIILAAGKGTRMRSDRPKVLHEVAHAPLLHHTMRAGAAAGATRTIVVAGYGADQVEKAAHALDPMARVVVQADQLGTGHAVQQAAPALEGFEGDAIVLYADVPFIRPETLDRLAKARNGADIVILGFEAADPARYGRLVMQDGQLERIVEWKDASEEERAITFCNSGVLAADAALLLDFLSEVTNDNAQGEFYLTDIVEIARARGLSVTAIACEEAETLGVNSRADLAAAETAFQAQARATHMENGVTLMAPETVFFAHDTVIGPDTLIEPNVVFGPDVTVENGATIRAFSHLEGAHVSEGATIGPYARLRPGAEIGTGAKIGNFVEIKKAEIHQGAKVSHLTYIGDATVGEEANIGAGTVTCNYDGVSKHHTEIGARAFIGSDTMLVAPVRVGDEAMTASGSVITRDVPDGDLALGRAQQANKPGLARKLFARLRAAKKE